LIKIRLRDEAPWSRVTLLNGTMIYRRKWTIVPDDTDYIAFKKWVEVLPVEEESTSSSEEATEKETADYSAYTKTQLLDIAKEKGLDTVNSTMKKSEIIEVLSNESDK